MPAPRKHECWKNEGEKLGYIENADGWCRLRMGKVRQSLGLEFVDGNRKKALKILKELQDKHRRHHLAVKLGLPLPVEPTVPTVSRLHQAIDEFEEVRYVGMKRHAQKNYERAFSFFCNDDCPMDYEAIFDQLKRCNASGQLDHNTRHRYLTSLSTFFEYCLERKWLTKNPVDTLAVKRKKKRADEFVRFTWEELDAIIEQMYRQELSRDYGLAIEFLRRTAMRPGEALRLRWENVRPGGIRVVEKGSLEDFDAGAVDVATREVPLKAIPGLAEVVGELREVQFHQSIRLHRDPEEWLFRWKEPTKLRTAFNDARTALKMPADGRVLYTLRASGIWWMEHDLGWDRQAILDTVGHSDEVNKLFYRAKPSAEELEERIMRRGVDVSQ